MFTGLKQQFDAFKTKRVLDNSPLASSLAQHTKEYFANVPRLAGFSDDGQQNIIGDFSRQVEQIIQAENPVMTLRETMAEYITQYAVYQVLCITEKEKAIHPFLSDNEYLSATMYKQIDKFVEQVEELAELKWKRPDISNEDITDFCNGRSIVLLYYVNGFNIVRLYLKDYEDEKDWLDRSLLQISYFRKMCSERI